jgi:hypothetical protein
VGMMIRCGGFWRGCGSVCISVGFVVPAWVCRFDGGAVGVSVQV